MFRLVCFVFVLTYRKMKASVMSIMAITCQFYLYVGREFKKIICRHLGYPVVSAVCPPNMS